MLAGLVERVTFHNEENGFCVLRTKARGQRDLMTVIGQAATDLRRRVDHGERGMGQRPHARAAIQSAFPEDCRPDFRRRHREIPWLRHGSRDRPRLRQELVRAFGEKVFDTIEAEPVRLQEVDGIGPVRGNRITDSWAEQKAIREIMMFLHSNGVGTARAVRIYKTYGSDAVQVMTENPYRLTRDVRGIGFKTADAIAMRLGFEKTAIIRLRAGISYALAEAMDEGHCGLPTRS